MALHILVVDDDEDVRNMLVEMLHFASFLTTAANSGARCGMFWPAKDWR
jgi:CheY-like chemotaxis protein